MDHKEKLHLKEFLKSLKIKFNNLDLLEIALSHRSYVNERPEPAENNEKLEFLGDSVLGLIITEYLFRKFPGLVEGDLARIKSFVVSEETLSNIGKKINLNQYIKIGKGEEMTGGREKRAIIADAFEAFLGAMYIDNKYAKVQDFVIKHFKEEVELVVTERQGRDYKTLLQEYAQKRYKDCPKYRLVAEDGPEHNKTFYMEVSINDQVIGNGEGKSKKEAEKAAAKGAFLKLTAQPATTEIEKEKPHDHKRKK